MGHSNDTVQHSSLSSNSGLGDGNNQIANSINSNSNSLREHALHSPLYNFPHSMMNHSNIGIVSGNGNNSNNGQYVQSGMLTQSTGLGIGISSQFSAAGLKADGSSTCTLNMSDGPPTPTQELDMTTDHRKSKFYFFFFHFFSAFAFSRRNIHFFFFCFCFLVDGTSASLSSLSTQLLRHQGPSLTPSLANYIRADLIAHVTNWPAEMLEKQVCHKHHSSSNSISILFLLKSL